MFNINEIKKKMLIVFVAIFFLTGSDLFVKKVVEDNLRVIPREFEKDFFEKFILLNFNNEIIKNGYVLKDGKYVLVEKDNRKLHKIWKDLKFLGNDKKIEVIKGFWFFIYETNEDIGFSILRFLDNFMKPDTKRIFLIFLQTFGVFIIFLYYLFNKERYLNIPLAIIIGGALGNVIDRIFRGYVVDYVMWIFSFIPHPLFNPWPIFNLADVYTVIGAILLFVFIFLFEKKKKKNE